VIVVAIINYSGKKVPTMIIFKGIYYLRGHFLKELDGGICFA
jgi:hypothetical protein